MFEVKHNPYVPEQDHHDFIYEQGKKIPKPEPKVWYAYIDGAGLFHVTRWEDDASRYGDGVYAVTDVIKGKNGLPAVGKIEGLKIWGADQYSVKLSKDSDERFHVATEPINNGFIVPRNNPSKMEACTLLRDMYLALAAKKAEL